MPRQGRAESAMFDVWLSRSLKTSHGTGLREPLSDELRQLLSLLPEHAGQD